MPTVEATHLGLKILKNVILTIYKLEKITPTMIDVSATEIAYEFSITAAIHTPRPGTLHWLYIVFEVDLF